MSSSQRGNHRGRGRGGGDRGRGSQPSGGRGGPGGFRGGPPGRGRGGGGREKVEIFQERNLPQLPLRLKDSSQADLISAFSKLRVTPSRPLRPGFGSVGQPLILRANFFPLKLPKGPFYDYVVEITPKTDIGRVKGRLFEILEESQEFRPFLAHVAHDRTQRLVSARQLPQPLEISVPFFESRTRPTSSSLSYLLTIKLDRELDLSLFTRHLNGDVSLRDMDNQPVLSALNLILQAHPSHVGTRVGKNKYYFRSERPDYLSHGVEAWRGYFTSVRPTFKQPMVNLNVCMTAFIAPGNLADTLNAFRTNAGGLPTLPPKFAKSIKPFIRHLRSKRVLKAIGHRSARDTFFDCEELGGKISVEHYFLRKHKIKLQHPHDLPVIDIGSKRKNIWIPAELCDILPGDPLRGRLDDQETAKMIKLACNRPATNASHIVTEGFPLLGLNPKKEPLNGFGVAVSAEMAAIPARELPPPNVTYGSGLVQVNNASWNTTKSAFVQPASAGGWGVLIVRDGTMSPETGNHIKALADRFRKRCIQNGMKLGQSQPILTDWLPSLSSDPGRKKALDNIHSNIKSAIQKFGSKPSFLLVILSKVDSWIYPGIKHICDVWEGIPSITMLQQKVVSKTDNQQDQYVANVALKLNVKLGGRNHSLDPRAMKWLTKKKTMLVGVDVTHPGPTSRPGSPSIAAVVASVDDHFVQFPASMRIQKPEAGRASKEMLDELRDMLIERLQLYNLKNGIFPDRVLIFRDGVSEGQFDIVIREELAQAKDAFRKLSHLVEGQKYDPKLTIVICGKRHHARFYPTDSQYATSNGNTRPGTVIDRGVTAVYDFDFYLQAHAGLQGSIRPTHYTVVYDENQLGADELQQGAHTFSYSYARATKAVSLIPPAYYADLACERGRCYLNSFFVDDKGSVSSGLSKDEERERTFNEAKTAWGNGINDALKHTMFYI